jgi:nucleotidyltransferase/DNA polymerase involved in DNA repair
VAPNKFLAKIASGWKKPDGLTVIAPERVESFPFAHDLTHITDIRDEIAAMARDAAAWLLKRALYARTVTIKVRYHDFTTITRSHTEDATRDEDNIVRRAVGLLDKTDAGKRPVRLLGVSVHNLSENLFTRPENPQPSLPFDMPSL